MREENLQAQRKNSFNNNRKNKQASFFEDAFFLQEETIKVFHSEKIFIKRIFFYIFEFIKTLIQIFQT